MCRHNQNDEHDLSGESPNYGGLHAGCNHSDGGDGDSHSDNYDALASGHDDRSLHSGGNGGHSGGRRGGSKGHHMSHGGSSCHSSCRNQGQHHHLRSIRLLALPFCFSPPG